MRNINIQVHENHTVDFENGYAGLNLENLQGNITFNFDNFISGNARVEIVINNQDGYINIDKVGQTYTLPIKSSLLTGEDILMQLVIEQEPIFTEYQGEIDPKQTYYVKEGESYIAFIPTRTVGQILYVAETPVWKSEVFFLKVGTSINATATIPEEYPSWVDTINNLITETENAIDRAGNVNISSEQLDDGVKVITTNQDGEQTITIVPQGPQGEPGVPGAVKFIIVNELPTEDIQTDTIYLVPSDDPTTQDMYLEYMYINNAWELLGQKQIVVDLTDYVKFTDYATTTTAGVVKVPNWGGLSISAVGNLSGLERTYAQYQSAENMLVVAKGTLENVITGKGLTTKSYVDGLVGDIGTILDNINNEVL